ncbi:MAG: nucleoside deaminase [Chlorogloea purpurea SAG 13.99]|nr:nucleoside deaminase [Chlorogloea purpurea SAG 13.99]
MGEALELAREAGRGGDIPVGAIVTDKKGNFLAGGENRKQRDQDPTAHAEIIAIRAASQKLNNWHLNDCTLYVTLEPCPMCAGAIIAARLGLLIYGADDPKTGVIRTVANFPDSLFSNHHLNVIEGILESQCREMLQHWFRERRRKI